MNKKQFIILLVLAVIVGGAGLVYYRNQSSTWTSDNATIGQKLLGTFPVNDIAQIHIQQTTNELTLEKKNDLWRVKQRDDYPANFSDLSSLLLKLRDLKVVQTEKVGPSQLPRLDLAKGKGTNSPTVVEFRDAGGKTIKTLLLGKEHMKTSQKSSPMDQFGGGGYPDGRYVMVGGNDTVSVISDPLSNVEPKPASWLDKDFFKVDKVRSLAVAFPQATNSWKLTRETQAGPWKLANAKPGEKLDSSKTSAFSNPLSSPGFVDVVLNPKPAETGLDNSTNITLQTFDGFDYQVKVGAKTNDDYYLTVAVSADLPKERTPGKDEKPADKAKLDKEFKDKQQKLEDKLAAEKKFGKWTYLVSSWTVDSLLKKRSELLEEKKPETKKDESKSAEKTAAPKKAGT